MKPDTHLIAVVIPTLGNSPALRRTLGSVSRQSLVPDEVIVVANGPSAADVASTVSRWSELRPAPRVIDIGDPPGVARALNVGFRSATSKYVARMDVGDCSYRQRFEMQVALMEGEGLDVLGSGIDLVTPRGLRLPTLRGPLPTDALSLKWHLLVQNCIPHPTTMLRRKAVIAAGLYDERMLIEDYDLWLRMLDEWRMRLIDTPLVQYVRSGQSRTHEVKHEGSHQLVPRLSQAWQDVAGIDLSENAAARLLTPDLPHPRSIPRESSLEAMSRLNELEILASERLESEGYFGIRYRIAVSRAALVMTTAAADPVHGIQLLRLVPRKAMPTLLRVASRMARFALCLQADKSLPTFPNRSALPATRRLVHR